LFAPFCSGNRLIAAPSSPLVECDRLSWGAAAALGEDGCHKRENRNGLVPIPRQRVAPLSRLWRPVPRYCRSRCL